MLDKIQITLQYLMPQFWLTALAGWGAERRGAWLTRWVIKLFVRYYKVDMQEAEQPDIAAYPTFNTFFIRSLREDVRPIDADPSVIVFPADGMISQLGPIQRGQLFQAKGHYYSLEALLVGHESMITYFYNGSFVTTYLAPRDYHRVHMPCNGLLCEMLYVPGKLFSVNLLTAANIPNLFTRNERVICLFQTNFGPMAQILIGATIVGSIETIWAGTVTPPRKSIIKLWRYPTSDTSEALVMLKGREMGRFKMGSTIINLFNRNTVRLGEHISTRYVTRVGQRLAHGIAQTDSTLS
ncbi:archaetidylserine decarboxylase [secondary endosymbiont of Ctenarytaina eucalypti]|uniref:Phosphatidylserine decarboxylase proenzyme n=1 Tax=secondary endosymbiont of Ctenarytaina eucalypti TaxID=1199245 RepID=J3TX56_9ENTR|nr:archaetidylserine decarboxylase [secondary endosymbiont of Ctenarytaina eucalypti]AFP84695.1 phosphatidylserine decarboxylase precursor [secondary endosymbiont of Ctenarytaina eucalypti]